MIDLQEIFNQNEAMRASKATQGSTLIVVVLGVLLILSILLAATLRLSLSSRQSSGDQKAILQAQYKAESGISLAQSRLRDIKSVISAKGPDGVTPYMYAQSTMTAGTVDQWAKQFCGQSAVNNPWTPFTPPANFSMVGTMFTCNVNYSGLDNQKFAVLGNIITPAAYASLPKSDSAPTTANATNNTAWWEKYLNKATLGDTNYSVLPTRVIKVATNSSASGTYYRFYLAPNSLTSQSTVNGAIRSVSAKGASDSDWWFQIIIPNPFDNALMVNTWGNSDGGFVNDVIKGNVFSNQYIRFLQSTNSVQFLGDVKSASCTSFPTVVDGQPTPDCPKNPGFYGSLNSFQTPRSTSKTADDINNDLESGMQNQGASISGNANFMASYTPLPLKSQSQSKDAGNGGITVPSSVTNVELVAGDSNGNPLKTYNSATSSWDESGGVYQYIRLKSYSNNWTQVSSSVYSSYPASQKTIYYGGYYVHQATTTEYRVGADNYLYKLSGGTWVNQNSQFNGVIYSDHQVSVNGPNRIGNSQTSDVSKMPPALASFSKINLTVDGGMSLDSDLTDSNTPCGFDNKFPDGSKQQGCPKSPTNVLALFAPSGDITMSQYTPNEATYHAAILSSQGTFKVDAYDKRNVQGSRHVVGAVVEQHYGLNGTVDSYGNMTSGYGDDFSQDIRLKDVNAIPSNPIVNGNWQFSNASDLPTNLDYKNLSHLIWKQGTKQ